MVASFGLGDAYRKCVHRLTAYHCFFVRRAFRHARVGATVSLFTSLI